MSMNIKKTDILINKDEKKYTTLSKEQYNGLRGCLSRNSISIPKDYIGKKIDKEIANNIIELASRDINYNDYHWYKQEDVDIFKSLNKDLVISYLIENASINTNLSVKQIETCYNSYTFTDEELEGLDFKDANAIDNFCIEKYEDYNTCFDVQDDDREYDGYDLKVSLKSNLPHESQITEFNYNVEEEKKSA